MSSPSEVYFIIQNRETSSSELIKTSMEVLSYGFFGGIFGGEANIYVGDLSSPGDYSIWIALKSDDFVSDVYYYEFVIPRNFSLVFLNW